MHTPQEQHTVSICAVVSGGNALISASDLLGLQENSNLQRLSQREEQLPARFQQGGRWQGPLAPCCRLAGWACSHAVHAAAAEWVLQGKGSKGRDFASIDTSNVALESNQHAITCLLIIKTLLVVRN
jgi:hypothetical protein